MQSEEPPIPEGKQHPRMISVSLPPGKRAEFFNALAKLQRNHKNPFIQAAPLLVDTIIEAAKGIQAEEREQ